MHKGQTFEQVLKFCSSQHVVVCLMSRIINYIATSNSFFVVFVFFTIIWFAKPATNVTIPALYIHYFRLFLSLYLNYIAVTFGFLSGLGG